MRFEKSPSSFTLVSLRAFGIQRQLDCPSGEVSMTIRFDLHLSVLEDEDECALSAEAVKGSKLANDNLDWGCLNRRKDCEGSKSPGAVPQRSRGSRGGGCTPGFSAPELNVITRKKEQIVTDVYTWDTHIRLRAFWAIQRNVSLFSKGDGSREQACPS